MSLLEMRNELDALNAKRRAIHYGVSGLSYKGNESRFDALHALEDDIEALVRRIKVAQGW